MSHQHDSIQLTAPARGNVLVVEDDNDIATTITVIISDAGYGVRKVSSRESALKVLQDNLYQCVLVDYYMPGMSADVFTTTLKAIQPLSKIVLITAAAREVTQIGRTLD
jgi:CheY-like chemotaxis protein